MAVSTTVSTVIKAVASFATAIAIVTGGSALTSAYQHPVPAADAAPAAGLR